MIIKHLVLAICMCTALYLTGCTSPSERINAVTGLPPGSASVLVLFVDGCPQEVMEPFPSCNPPKGVDYVCRNPKDRLSWLAVPSLTPPYNGISEEYSVDFTSNPLADPKCKDAKNGVARCKIKDAAKGEYYYKITSGKCPVLDPRIWVN